MVDAAVRGSLLLGVLLFACARGEELTGDGRPITTTPLPMTDSTAGSSESGESTTTTTGAESSTTEPESTTATPMTEPGGTCPEGTPYCPCGLLGCGELSCVDGVCQPTGCGNGVHEPDAGEQCDDGDDDLSDECVLDCMSAKCGDGYVHVGVELCDAGAGNSDTGSCKLNCAPQACGDGLIGPGENCDDGNDINNDECTNKCAPSGCGDMIVGGTEECDDGNIDDTDGCLNTCLLAECGDGVIWANMEACDDGNGSDNDACKVDCTPAVCGDGIVRFGVEACDDGNVIETDECDNSCELVSTLVGEFDVHAGPAWADDPKTYSCKEACAQIFGGVATDYACSTSATEITGTAFLSGWGDAKFCDAATDDDFKTNTQYDCGGPGCSFSAYVEDHCSGGTSVNYCWKP